MWSYACIVIGFTISLTTGSTILESKESIPFGSWYNWDECRQGTFVHGFEIKAESYSKWHILRDDDGMTGIRFFCQSLDGKGSNSITSTFHTEGSWIKKKRCPLGEYLQGYRLRVEGAILLDNTAANDIEVRCSGGTTMRGGGTGWGAFKSWQSCPPDEYFCGIKTRVRPSANVDSVGLVDLKIRCCQSPEFTTIATTTTSTTTATTSKTIEIIKATASTTKKNITNTPTPEMKVTTSKNVTYENYTTELLQFYTEPVKDIPTSLNTQSTSSMTKEVTTPSVVGTTIPGTDSQFTARSGVEPTFIPSSFSESVFRKIIFPKTDSPTTDFDQFDFIEDKITTSRQSGDVGKKYNSPSVGEMSPLYEESSYSVTTAKIFIKKSTYGSSTDDEETSPNPIQTEMSSTIRPNRFFTMAGNSYKAMDSPTSSLSELFAETHPAPTNSIPIIEGQEKVSSHGEPNISYEETSEVKNATSSATEASTVTKGPPSETNLITSTFDKNSTESSSPATEIPNFSRSGKTDRRAGRSEFDLTPNQGHETMVLPENKIDLESSTAKNDDTTTEIPKNFPGVRSGPTLQDSDKSASGHTLNNSDKNYQRNITISSNVNTTSILPKDSERQNTTAIVPKDVSNSAPNEDRRSISEKDNIFPKIDTRSGKMFPDLKEISTNLLNEDFNSSVSEFIKSHLMREEHEQSSNVVVAFGTSLGIIIVIFLVALAMRLKRKMPRNVSTRIDNSWKYMVRKKRKKFPKITKVKPYGNLDQSQP